MTLYRVKRTLDRNEQITPIGAIIRGRDWPEATLAALVQAGAIAQVATPPLAVLQEWMERASIALQHGIIMLDEFVEYDSAALADIYSVAIPEIESWKHNLLSRLAPPDGNHA